jgi:RNA polymerase sigma-70 factor, ECF subfamily
LFNFDREFSKSGSKLVASETAKQSVEQRQRDIFESHRHRTFSLAFYMTGNELEAEEILAMTFVRAFQRDDRPDAFGVDSALITELSGRFCLNQEQPMPRSSGDESLGDRNVRRTDLEVAVQNLPANERLLFLLRDVEGYAPEAIAKLLELPTAQVHRALLSARIRLRQILAQAPETTSEAA